MTELRRRQPVASSSNGPHPVDEHEKEEEHQPQPDETIARQGDEDEEQTHIHDPPPTSSLKKRILFLLVIGVFVWLAFFSKHSPFAKKKPEVIYAKRYSKEFKFRPAASPVITETLKDGRVRIRGAEPSKLSTPTPTPSPKVKGKKKGKKKSTTRKRKGKKVAGK
ncbi:hypothetical protein VNI00_011291 [Paramarasmius palmivorus]|uniref:Transmembrane protein n=1 Tax=Paramarasmius palmivorus TaxID=297713 RepID=A0AAW0CBT5_9AGAR